MLGSNRFLFPARRPRGRRFRGRFNGGYQPRAISDIRRSPSFSRSSPQKHFDPKAFVENQRQLYSKHDRYVKGPTMEDTTSIRDFHIASLPSSISEDDIKKALRVYNIGLLRVNIRERNHDRTRFAYLTPQTAQDFLEMNQLQQINVKGNLVRFHVLKDKSKEDQEKQHKARISTLISMAGDMGINLATILKMSPRPVSSEPSSRTCGTFHQFKSNSEQFKLTKSMKVDSMTNEVQQVHHVADDSGGEDRMDDVVQEDTSLEQLNTFYSSRELYSAILPQTFEEVSHDPTPNVDSEIGECNSMLRNLHLARRGGRIAGTVSNRPSSTTTNISPRTSTPPSASKRLTPYQGSLAHPPSQTVDKSPQSDQSQSRSSGFLLGSRSVVSTGYHDNHEKPSVAEQPIIPDSLQEAPTPVVHPTVLQPKLHMNLQKHSRAANAVQHEAHSRQEAWTLPLGAPPPLVVPPPLEAPPLFRDHKKYILDVPYDFKYLLSSPRDLDIWIASLRVNALTETRYHSDEKLPPGTALWEHPSFSSVSSSDNLTPPNLSFSTQPGNCLSFSNNFIPPQSDNLVFRDDKICLGTPGICTPPDSPTGVTGTKLQTDETTLQEAVQLLMVFRGDLEAALKRKDFQEIEGITFHVNQLFSNLCDKGLVDEDTLYCETGNVQQAITASMEEIEDIEVLLEELEEGGEDDDLIEEIRGERLSEKREELLEQRADLLDIKMMNVIELNMSLDRASIPSSSDDCRQTTVV